MYTTKYGMTDMIENANGNCSYYAFRFTPGYFNEPQDWSDKGLGALKKNYIMTKLMDYMRPDKYTCCLEKLDSKGKPTSPHIHIHMESDRELKKDTLQKWIRTELGASGNKAYCVQVFSDVDDEDRWFRYCFKEKDSPRHSKGFSESEIRDMTLLAQDEREQQVKLNLKTEAELENKHQFRDKMFKHMRLNHPDISDEEEVFELIGNYYRSQNKMIPFSKLRDITNDWLCHAGHITLRSYFQKYYKKEEYFIIPGKKKKKTP